MNKMYLLDFRSKYGFSLGLIFVICVSILMVSLLASLVEVLRNQSKIKKSKEMEKKDLESLNRYSRTIIYDLFQKDNHIMKLPLYNEDVCFLRDKGMIEIFFIRIRMH
ncbi:hypothetical protein FACS189418_0290 [Clostridia bacterium]|nr:hypothetical protein FACS189418_0290 [Clostridia bacterium]